jgi:GxxExxY protein
MELDKLTHKIIGCAIEVHKALGPGLLENIYKKCLILELQRNSLNCVTEKIIEIDYKGIPVDCDLRLDILVEDEVIIELKSVKELLPIHEAQLLTYMKLLNKKKGLLINFNVLKLIDGVNRLVT